jgi:hypothetical protein
MAGFRTVDICVRRHDTLVVRRMNGEWMSRSRRGHSHLIRHPPQECGGSLGSRISFATHHKSVVAPLAPVRRHDIPVVRRMTGEWMSRLRRGHSHLILHPPQECGGSLASHSPPTTRVWWLPWLPHLIRHPPQECGGSLGTRKGAETPVRKSAMGNQDSGLPPGQLAHRMERCEWEIGDHGCGGDFQADCGCTRRASASPERR